MARNYPECEWIINSSYVMHEQTVEVYGRNCTVENSSCTECVFTWLTDGFVYSVIVCYSIILTLGFFGNLAVIITILTVRELKIVINLLLVALAFSDLIITIAMPFTFISHISYEYLGSVPACRTIPLIQGMAVMSGIYTLVIIAVERYCVIVRPLRSRFLNSSFRVGICVGIIWFASACFQIPPAIVLDVVTFSGLVSLPNLDHMEQCPSVCLNMTLTLCIETWNEASALGYSYANLLFMYAIPLGCITFLYIKISQALWKRRPVGTASKKEVKSYLQKKKLITFLIVLVVSFAVLWGPYFIMHCIPSTATAGPYVYTYLQMLGHLNVAINPILYAYFHQKVRKHAFGYLRRASQLFRSSDSSKAGRQDVPSTVEAIGGRAVWQTYRHPEATNSSDRKQARPKSHLESQQSSSSEQFASSYSYDDLVLRISDVNRQMNSERNQNEMRPLDDNTPDEGRCHSDTSSTTVF